MKKNAITFTAALVLLLPGAGMAQASEVPDRISYQGIVTDVTGDPIAPTTPENHEMIFRLWNNSTASGAGNLVYSEKQVVTISKGEFSVLIGAGSDVTSQHLGFAEASKGPGTVNVADVFDGGERYLGVTVAVAVAPGGIVASDSEITPRQQMVSTGFAFRAKHAETISDNAVGTGSISDGSITLAKLATSSVGSSSIVDNSILTTDVSDGAITAAKLGSDVGVWSLSGSNAYRLGSVGIGRAPILGRLDVNGGYNNTDALYVRSASGGTAYRGGIVHHQDNNIGFREAIASSDTTGNVTMRFDFVDRSNPTSVLTTTGHPLMVFRGTGNVGIGKTDPTERLDVNGNLRVNGSCYLGGYPGHIINAGSGSGYYVDHVTDATGYNVDVGSSVRGMRWSINGSEKMRVHTNGNVGIGTTSPTYPLTIEKTGGGVSFSGSDDVGFVPNGTGLIPFSTGSVSLRVTNGGVWSDFFVASSDRRIKEVKELSDGEDDLRIIGELQVTDYTMVDEAQYGSAIRKGFIAQKVREVVPEAVTEGQAFLPDVYQLAKSVAFDEERKRTQVKVADAHGLEAGERVRIHADQSFHDLEVLEVPDARSMVLSGELSEAEVFVYGREVDDFLSVDYDRIFTTAVSALQQLKKEKDAELAELREENSELKRELDALKKREAARDNELTQIKAMLGSMSSVPAVAATSDSTVSH